MKITSQAIQSALITSGSATLLGPVYPVLCKVLSQAISTWLTTSVALSGVTSGQSGTGKVVGVLGILPNSSMVMSGLVGAGVVGQQAGVLSTAVSDGLGVVFSSGVSYSGTSVGVASGVESVVTVVANPVALASLIKQYMVVEFQQGTLQKKAIVLADGLGQGIASLLTTAYTISGTVIPVGVVGPTPAAGTSVGVII